MDERDLDPIGGLGRPTTRRAMARWAFAGSLVVGAGPGVADVAARRQNQPAGRAGVTGRTPWRQLGDTPAAVFRAEFDRLGSPMLREADAIRGELGGFSRLYLAMAFMETKYATYQETIPASRHNALAVKAGNGSGRWDRYPSFRAGARAWVRLLSDPDGPYASADTLRDLIAIYAPRSDNNQVTRYVATVVAQIERFPLAPEPEPEPEPEQKRSAPASTAERGSARGADRSSGDGPSRGAEIARANRLRLAQQRLAPGEAEDGRLVEGDA